MKVARGIVIQQWVKEVDVHGQREGTTYTSTILRFCYGETGFEFHTVNCTLWTAGVLIRALQ